MTFYTRLRVSEEAALHYRDILDVDGHPRSEITLTPDQAKDCDTSGPDNFLAQDSRMKMPWLCLPQALKTDLLPGNPG